MQEKIGKQRKPTKKPTKLTLNLNVGKPLDQEKRKALLVEHMLHATGELRGFTDNDHSHF